MSADTDSGRAGQSGLEDVHNVSIEEKSSTQVLTSELAGRWQTLLAIVALGATSGLLWYMDGGFSLDMLVFSVLTVLLVVYFLLTLRNDLRLE
jgi:hypothetical protein